MKEKFIPSFVEWVRVNTGRLAADNITVRLPEKIVSEGTYAEFFAASGEATVEMWDYGFSEFHLCFYCTDPQQEEVETTHYEFQSYAEMYSALDELVRRMGTIIGSEPINVGRHFTNALN